MNTINSWNLVQMPQRKFDFTLTVCLTFSFLIIQFDRLDFVSTIDLFMDLVQLSDRVHVW